MPWYDNSMSTAAAAAATIANTEENQVALAPAAARQWQQQQKKMEKLSQNQEERKRKKERINRVVSGEELKNALKVCYFVEYQEPPPDQWPAVVRELYKRFHCSRETVKRVLEKCYFGAEREAGNTTTFKVGRVPILGPDDEGLNAAADALRAGKSQTEAIQICNDVHKQLKGYDYKQVPRSTIRRSIQRIVLADDHDDGTAASLLFTNTRGRKCTLRPDDGGLKAAAEAMRAGKSQMEALQICNERNKQLKGDDYKPIHRTTMLRALKRIISADDWNALNFEKGRKSCLDTKNDEGLVAATEALRAGMTQTEAIEICNERNKQLKGDDYKPVHRTTMLRAIKKISSNADDHDGTSSFPFVSTTRGRKPVLGPDDDGLKAAANAVRAGKSQMEAIQIGNEVNKQLKGDDYKPIHRTTMLRAVKKIINEDDWKALNFPTGRKSSLDKNDEGLIAAAESILAGKSQTEAIQICNERNKQLKGDDYKPINRSTMLRAVKKIINEDDWKALNFAQRMGRKSRLDKNDEGLIAAAESILAGKSQTEAIQICNERNKQLKGDDYKPINRSTMLRAIKRIGKVDESWNVLNIAPKKMVANTHDEGLVAAAEAMRAGMSQTEVIPICNERNKQLKGLQTDSSVHHASSRQKVQRA